MDSYLDLKKCGESSKEVPKQAEWASHVQNTVDALG
jgi:hypothetical protein